MPFCLSCQGTCTRYLGTRRVHLLLYLAIPHTGSTYSRFRYKKRGTYRLNGTPYPVFGYFVPHVWVLQGYGLLNKMQSIGENVMTPHQIWTNFLLTTYGVWLKTYVKHFATLFKFHWILSKSGRLILHWFTINVFMVLCSAFMEHNLTTKCAHKKYTYIFNTEKYIDINEGIYLAICNFLLLVTAVQISV